jgi:hypothetical protein
MQLQSRHYKSSDETTGGFNEFSLDLNSNKKLLLTITTSKAGEQNEAGSVWENKTQSITGTWNTDNEKIICSFDKPKSSIDSIFIDTDWKDAFTKKELVTFSQKLDTAYIYGFPCQLNNDTLKLN